MKTLYDLLGVPREATRQEIEQEYRRYLNTHISNTAGRPPRKREQQQLQRVRNAYLILCSPVRREAYEQTLLLREQRRHRLLEIGGRVAAVACLIAGTALIVGGSYLRHD